VLSPSRRYCARFKKFHEMKDSGKNKKGGGGGKKGGGGFKGKKRDYK
jgi:hypothetical protein